MTDVIDRTLKCSQVIEIPGKENKKVDGGDGGDKAT